MKTLILTALMGTTMATVNANTSPAAIMPTFDGKTVEMPAPVDPEAQAFMDRIAFHQWNHDMAWQQYDQIVVKIKAKPGSVSNLESQMNALIQYYQDDIDQGVRLEDSRKAIAEIRVMYGKKIEKQAKAEAREIARIQALLGRELDREEGEFNTLKAAHADQINAHTEPLVRSMERQFAHSSLRMEAWDDMASLASR